MNKIKLLVCDWDGTIIDSLSQIIACKKYLAQKYHLTIANDTTIRASIGLQFQEALSICFPTSQVSMLHKLTQEFHALMQENRYQSKPFPNAKKILLYFKSKGMKLAIASSKTKSALGKSIQHNNLSELFDIVCCGEEFTYKPNPAILKHIMKQTGTSSESSLMIGDSITDIDCAHNANIKGIGITTGAHTKEILQTANPFAIIDEWMELYNIMDEQCFLNSAYS